MADDSERIRKRLPDYFEVIKEPWHLAASLLSAFVDDDEEPVTSAGHTCNLFHVAKALDEENAALKAENARMREAQEPARIQFKAMAWQFHATRIGHDGQYSACDNPVCVENRMLIAALAAKPEQEPCPECGEKIESPFLHDCPKRPGSAFSLHEGPGNPNTRNTDSSESQAAGPILDGKTTATTGDNP